MPVIETVKDADGMMEGRDVVQFAMGERTWRVGLMKRGMQSGASAVMLAIEIEPGKWLLTETSYAAFRDAARILAVWEELS